MMLTNERFFEKCLQISIKSRNFVPEIRNKGINNLNKKIMETKFEKIQNSLNSIFGTNTFEFKKIDNESCCVRSSKTCMICGCELIQLINLCLKLHLSFYVRSKLLENGEDCVEFVIY